MYFSNLSGRIAALFLWVTVVTACGGGGGSAPTPAPAPALVPLPVVQVLDNQLTVMVDSGPAGSGYNVNRLYASVTICEPASTTRCQTIDHVLVDSGSTGLRLLSSVLAPGLNLTRVTDAQSRPLLNCAQFVDNTYAWGSVARADVWLGGKSATSVPIQIMADPMAGSAAVACSVGATSLDAVADLGANGIIGLSIFRQDCGSSCTTNHRAANGYYYACTSGGTTSACTASTGTTVSLSNQLQNPVPLFTSDNNGVLIDLPAVAPGGVPTVSGLLIFGIATRSNNTPAAGLATLTTNVSGNFSTLLSSTTPSSSYGTSFIDTGSNGIYFSTGALPVCTGPGMGGFYCPVGTANLSATLTGANAVTANILFSIDNASTLFAVGSNAVLPTLGGGTGSASMFDWGLPFYYGRRVFMGIESVAGSGAYYAF